MKPTIWGWVLAGAIALGAAGCQCPPYAFTPEETYRITVVESAPVPFNQDFPPCSDAPASRPPSLTAGDSFELIGEADNGEGPWCGSEGELYAKPGTPAWFATDLLTTCDGHYCRGTTATGCRPEASFWARRDGARWTIDIAWQNTCGEPRRCKESYAISYAKVAR